MGVAQNIWIMVEKKGHVNSFKTIIGLIFAMVCNWVLIPLFGLVGAAYSAVLTYFIIDFLINYFFIKKLFYMQIGIIKQ
jgi:PST family polysaccharide transporter